MSEEQSFDFLVIGGGPGGYVAAIRAAQLGLKAACIERRPTLGGTCLNVGCIPSKALLDSTELLDQIQHHAVGHGIVTTETRVELPVMMERKDRVVSTLTRGVEGLFRKNGVTWIHGTARLVEVNNALVETEVEDERGSRRKILAPHTILATGSAPASIPGVEIDEDRVLSSTGALSLQQVPEHLVVIGGGVVGMELGSVWRRLGARVTILEWTDTILPGFDRELVSAAARAFRKQGFTIQTGARVESVSRTDRGISVAIAGSEPVEGDRVLVAIGRKPFADGLGIESCGIQRDRRGAVIVDDQYRTSVNGIYAIGDLIGGAMLAHKAMEEGAAVAEIASGKKATVDYEAVAGVVYTSPEIASVGQTEEALRQAGIPFRVGKFPFLASGRARALDDTEGFVKLLAHESTGRLLGAHIIGPRASELIAEACLALEFRANIEDLALSVHAHPTLSEALKEAALQGLGRPIHL